MAAAVLHQPPYEAPARREQAPSFGGFLKAVRQGDHRVLGEVYGAREKAALNETSGAAGGYLVPTDYSQHILHALSEESFLFPRATVVPMASATINLPTIDMTTAPAAAGTAPWFGSLLFSWGFGQAPPSTNPKFREVQLTAWDLLGYTTASNQLLEDLGPGGDGFLYRLFGRAAAWYAEFAFLQGLGADGQMPLGIVNSPATVRVTRAATNHIAQADVAAMASKLMPLSWVDAIWACNPSCLGDVCKLTNYQPNENPTGAPRGFAGFLMGRPLFVTDKLPALGTAGDILFFDPRLYVIGDRQQIAVDVSEHPGFRTNQSDFRVWARLGGRPWLDGPVTLQDTTTQVGGFVALTA